MPKLFTGAGSIRAILGAAFGAIACFALPYAFALITYAIN